MQRSDAAAKDEDRSCDEQDVLEDACKSEDETTTSSDEEYGGNVQQERDKRIAEKDQGAVPHR